MKCQEKNKYFTRKEARRSARIQKRNSGKDIHCYICPECGYYHLTSMPRIFVVRNKE